MKQAVKVGLLVAVLILAFPPALYYTVKWFDYWLFAPAGEAARESAERLARSHRPQDEIRKGLE